MKNRKPVGPPTPMDAEATSARTTARLGRDVQAKIGQQLRALYDDVVQQGVPQRFADLLHRLDERQDKER
jgi:hypothetical protein